MQISHRIAFIRHQITTFFVVLIVGFPSIFAEAQIPLVDPTFRPDLPADGQVNAMILQADGSIVIGGGFNSVAGRPVSNLARLFSDGGLDETFGIGTDTGVLGLAQQADGKIIVGGNFTELQGAPVFGLGRLFPNGEVDTNFNAGLLFTSNNPPFKIAIRPDGKILVGTIANTNGGLFQLTTNGALDPNFIQTNIFEGYWMHSLMVQTNGTILAGGGFASVNGFVSPGLVKLNASGQVNKNFQTGLATNSDVFTILEQTNGGILVGGLFRHTNGTPNTVLQRLDTNFQWDASFQVSPFSPFDTFSGPYIRSAILQPDGKIVAGGNFEAVGGYHRLHIVRLDSAGHVDPCFDPGLGLGGYGGVNVVISQPDGRILAGGNLGVPGFVPNNVARLLPQGECDATRVYFAHDADLYYVAGTTPPGGTNILQVSTNLTDWIDIDTKTNSYIFLPTGISYDDNSVFYRIKRTP
jgi:uncharacterized delta-60 repeat protein